MSCIPEISDFSLLCLQGEMPTQWLHPTCRPVSYVNLSEDSVYIYHLESWERIFKTWQYSVPRRNRILTRK